MIFLASRTEYEFLDKRYSSLRKDWSPWPFAFINVWTISQICFLHLWKMVDLYEFTVSVAFVYLRNIFRRESVPT
jgi:hypothetical protein